MEISNGIIKTDFEMPPAAETRRQAGVKDLGFVGVISDKPAKKLTLLQLPIFLPIGVAGNLPSRLFNEVLVKFMATKLNLCVKANRREVIHIQPIRLLRNPTSQFVNMRTYLYKLAESCCEKRSCGELKSVNVTKTFYVMLLRTAFVRSSTLLNVLFSTVYDMQHLMKHANEQANNQIKRPIQMVSTKFLPTPQFENESGKQ